MMNEMPIYRLIMWGLQLRQVLVGLLLIALVVSCFGVSLAAFQTRQQYSELQKLTAASDALDSEYEKLLLEQSAWAGYARIDEVSKQQLKMQIPQREQVVVVGR